ncbi:hypothetical protein D3C74_204140 [compost metagenome]
MIWLRKEEAYGISGKYNRISKITGFRILSALFLSVSSDCNGTRGIVLNLGLFVVFDSL